jgi:hypothetical protein
LPSFSPFFDQMGLPEQAKMFGDGRPRNGKGSRNLASGLAPSPQEIEHRSARGIG